MSIGTVSRTDNDGGDPNLLFRHPDNAMADELIDAMDETQRSKALAILKALAS